MKEIRIDGIRLPVGADDREAIAIAAKKARIRGKETDGLRIVKKSIDARDKSDVRYVYAVSNIAGVPEVRLPSPGEKRKVAIAGFGPAGIFCALLLARAGFSVTVFERGKRVEDRKKSVDKFINERLLDPESNVQFGEGGAGTFSDGKLNTGVSGPLIRFVLNEFVLHGAPEDILYLAKPHVGSDRLPAVVKNLREEILRLGGEIRFGEKVEDVRITNGRVTAVVAGKTEYPCDAFVLAVGHSARDTFALLKEKGVAMERKAFAMGFRIEHPQREISVSQYGGKFAPLLPPADYRLATHKAERGVFTFCMCPGGYVMPAASEEGMVATNGMSNYLRDRENANSALLCEILPEDFCEGVLGGVELQRKLERAAFCLGGGDYSAPAQRVGDYLASRKTKCFGRVKPTYPLGVTGCDLSSLFPKAIDDCLKTGISDLGKKLLGFDDADAVLTGVESRSSSPVRILRNERGESVNTEGLYPCGEGCGYAGGIMSAAVDGIRIATAVAENLGGKSAENSRGNGAVSGQPAREKE